jgi:Cu/Ag efflux protein CusF
MNQSKSKRTWAVALVAAMAAACGSSSSEKEPQRPLPPQPRATASSASSGSSTTSTPPAAPTVPADTPTTGSGSAESPVAAVPVEEGPVAGVLEKTLTATATVTAIDLEARKVTLRRDDGETTTFVCGEEVRNLPQISVGDIVTCEYKQSLAYEVKKPGEASPSASVAGAAGRAKEGEMPGAAAGRVMKVTATIVAIDREMKRVSLQGPDGSIAVVQVRDAEKLSRVSVGELVEITYTEAVALSVSKPEAK